MNQLSHFRIVLASLLTLFMLTWSNAWADKRAEITFATKNHDFGDIIESAGDATCEFKFTNTGDAPLLLLRVATSCGCTSPEYSKQPIRPGESGSIKVTYHAKGRPGTFTKSIYVYDNSAPNHKTVLLISGNVISDSKPEESFTRQLGAGLRMKAISVSFFDVYPGRENRTRSLAVYNESDEPLQLTFSNPNKHIYVESEPQIIQPKKEGQILITYYPGRVKDWGTRKDYFKVFVKGKETQMSSNNIGVSAEIWEDFSELSSKEKANAPTVEVESTALDFGTTAQPKKKTILIKNTGKDKLYIRKIQNFEPDVFVCQAPKEVLRSGDSTTIEVTFCPDKCKLKSINHHITLITNDPNNSRIIINMTAGK